MRVASLDGGWLEIWDAELPRAAYPLFHALRERAQWIRLRFQEAGLPLADPVPPAS